MPNTFYAWAEVSGITECRRGVAAFVDHGACLWLTGRSGAGKSTVTKALVPLLEELGLTGSVLDVVPLLLKDRGESDSEAKLLRKAFVAREIARHGGVAICVTVSAREETRKAARALVGEDRFLEVFFDVPAHISEERRAARTNRPPLRKRLRRRFRTVRASMLHADAYETPTAPDLVLDSVSVPPEDNARAIVDLLRERGFLKGTRAGKTARA